MMMSVMALIPPHFLDAVVAIGVGDKPDKRQWIGTGFLYARAEKALENNKKTYTFYLVSNNHVLKGHKRIYIKFNSSTDLTSKDYVMDLIAKNGNNSGPHIRKLMSEFWGSIYMS